MGYFLLVKHKNVPIFAVFQKQVVTLLCCNCEHGGIFVSHPRTIAVHDAVLWDLDMRDSLACGTLFSKIMNMSSEMFECDPGFSVDRLAETPMRYAAMFRAAVGILAIVFLALVGAGEGAAQTPPGQAEGGVKAGSLTITAPWTRATPRGARVAGGYLKIANTGSAPDRLIGGTATFAGRIEVHEMSMSDGIMRMRPLTAGLEIRPGASVELAPGGYHLMLMDLKQQLREGETVAATLRFEKAGAVEVTFRVGGVGEGAGRH